MTNLFNHAYPYLDEHELNLDWLIAKMKELNIAFNEFKVVNNITFSGQWDITKQYPAWTIVSDNNIGYLSLQPVPVGVPLSNGAYWVEVIDYTAQIAGLESRVISLEGRADTDERDIAANRSDINKLLLSGRKFLFVGDSFATQATNWVDKACQYAGITAYENIAVAATSFSDGNFLNQITNYAGDKDSITDIVVGGGLNDSIYTAYSSTLINAIQAFAIYAKANYPNAQLWLAFMGNALDDSSVLSGRTLAKRKWARWMYSQGARFGFTIINNCDVALSTSIYNYGTDRLHPSVYGAEEIGQIIANGIKGIQNKPYRPKTNAAFLAYGDWNNISFNVDYEVDGNISKISSNGNMNFGVANALTLNVASNVQIGTISDTFFNEDVIIDCEVTVTDTGLFKVLPCQLIFSSGVVYLKVFNLNAGGTYWQNLSLTTAAVLYFNQFEKTFDTISMN